MFILRFILIKKKKKGFSVLTEERMDSFFGGKKGMLRTWIRFGTETAWLLGEAMPQRTEAKSEGVPVNRLTLNRKRNTWSSERGGNEERIDSNVDRVWWGRGREPGPGPVVSQAARRATHSFWGQTDSGPGWGRLQEWPNWSQQSFG